MDQGVIRCSPFDRGEAVHVPNTGDDALVVGWDNLTAIAPVHLVAIVLLGIVAGCDDDAGLTPQSSDGEAQLRGGPKGWKNVDAQAVSGQHLSRHPREFIALVPAVMGDGHRRRAFSLVRRQDVVRQALCRHGHHCGIHAVGARPHDPAHAPGAKGEVLVERLLQGTRVGIVQHGLYGVTGRRIMGRLGPHLGAFSDGIEVHGVEDVESDGNFACKQAPNACSHVTDL